MGGKSAFQTLRITGWSKKPHYRLIYLDIGGNAEVVACAENVKEINRIMKDTIKHYDLGVDLDWDICGVCSEFYKQKIKKDKNIKPIDMSPEEISKEKRLFYLKSELKRLEATLLNNKVEKAYIEGVMSYSLKEKTKIEKEIATLENKDKLERLKIDELESVIKCFFCGGTDIKYTLISEKTGEKTYFCFNPNCLKYWVKL